MTPLHGCRRKEDACFGDDLIMIHLNVLSVVAIGYFLCISIVSIKYFGVRDLGAKRGRLAISLFVSSTSILTIWLLLTNAPTPGIIQSLAIMLFIYASVLFVWTWRSNRNQSFDFAFSQRPPSFISKAGPYRWIRHPFYSSYCAFWLGSILATKNIFVLGSGCLLIALYVTAARREERIFRGSSLSMEYEEYAKRTGMLFPKIVPM
jgi:protein-S-isoprenylcysteine O-methyltransferase Ste14